MRRETLDEKTARARKSARVKRHKQEHTPIVSRTLAVEETGKTEIPMVSEQMCMTAVNRTGALTTEAPDVTAAGVSGLWSCEFGYNDIVVCLMSIEDISFFLFDLSDFRFSFLYSFLFFFSFVFLLFVDLLLFSFVLKKNNALSYTLTSDQTRKIETPVASEQDCSDDDRGFVSKKDLIHSHTQACAHTYTHVCMHSYTHMCLIY